MRKSVRDYVEDLKAEVDLVARFIQGGKDDFLQDERSQYAVMMAYVRIGEIVKQIPDDLLLTQPGIEWREIKGFRDVLIHRYFDINVVRVWDAAERLPALQQAINALLNALPDDESDETS